MEHNKEIGRYDHRIQMSDGSLCSLNSTLPDHDIRDDMRRWSISTNIEKKAFSKEKR